MQWPNSDPKNIIVKMPNWLGDLVMATPVLADLRQKYPSAKITAMCQSGIAPLLSKDPNINELYSYKRPSGWIRRSQHGEIIEAIRLGEYDLGVLLTNSFSSAWWFWRGHVKRRLGYVGNLRSLLLTDAVQLPPQIKTQHLVTTYKMVLEPLNIPVSNNDPQIYLTDDERQNAKDLLVDHGIPVGSATILGINPGAAYGSAKCWLPESYLAVTQKMLLHQNLYVVYFGDPAGASLVNEICAKIPNTRVINLAGKTSLRELLSLISYCTIFLTNDSGPMHVASALGIPLLALFGSTDDTRTGPYKNGKVIHKHVECSPCYKRVCPIDFKCMKRIGVDEVYHQLQLLIEEQSK
jgi:heptosyltransferase-2